MHISNKTLNELEFDKVLEQISNYGISTHIKDKLKNIRPLNLNKALISLQSVHEYLSSFENKNIIPFNHYESITYCLHTLIIENYKWDIINFVKTKNLILLINNLITFLEKYKEYYPTLYSLIAQFKVNKEIINLIDKVFNRLGEIKSDASPQLKNIREEIKNNNKLYHDSFSSSLIHYKKTGALDVINESIIDGIRVLAVNSTHKKKVKGFVLGISKTASITFIQPEICRKYSNLIKEFQEKEKYEIDKILVNLTKNVANYYTILVDFQELVYLFDCIQAKAKYAQLIGATLPKVNTNKKIHLINAIHPLLFLSNKTEGKPTIPQNILLHNSQRIISISGPNAGGKSITLKTVGLLQVMFQSGILVSIHPNSEMSFFDSILTDIGDGQSIENQLSTYSSRLHKMNEIINTTDENTLLLIDEFGTGSDPELGGALAETFLEFFYEKKSFAILTTHYTNIKLKIEELPYAINACMLFDENTLEPIYKLELGQAGSSYTFEVAIKNNIPLFLIDLAKEKIFSDTLHLDKTIIKLQKEKYQIEKLRNDLSSQKEQIIVKNNNINKLENDLKEKLINFKLLYDQEQKIIFLGRRLQQFIESYTQGTSKKDIFKKFMNFIEQEKHKKLQIEPPKSDKEIIKTRGKVKRKLSKNITKNITKDIVESPTIFKEGMLVKIIGSSSVATIYKIEKNKVILNYGKFTTQTQLKELEKV